MNKVPGLNSNVFFDPVGLPFSQVSSEVPFPTGAIAYYRMDESSGAVIDAVNGYNGVNNGATPNVTGKINTAYDFDGLVDYINLDALVTPLASTTQGTWSCWVKPVDASSPVEFVISLGDLNQNTQISMFFSGARRIQAQLNNLGVNKWNIYNNISISDGVWTHVALVQDGVSPKIYINGVDNTVIAGSNDLTQWNNNLSGVDIFSLGVFKNRSASFFDGTIDEVGIWDRALSATEISNLYNGGSGKTLPIGFPPNAIAYYRLDEASGAVIDAVNGYNGTNNGATPNVTGKINTAYEFDGLVDFINLDALITPLASTTQGTWSMWVKPVDATPSSTERVITFSDTNANETIGFNVQATSGVCTAFLIDSGVVSWVLSTDAIAYSDGVWTHVAIVQDSVSPVIYIDGVEVAQTFSNSTDKTKWFNDCDGLDNGRIGDLNYGGIGEVQFLNGTIDEVGIWTRALSATEISNLYNGGNGRQI